MKKTIAIIEKNKCQFDDLEQFAMPLLYKLHTDNERFAIKERLNNYLWSVISPYVKFEEVDEMDLAENICTHVATDFPDVTLDKLFYHTESSYSSPKKFLEIFYAQNPNEKDKNFNNMNNLGCLFSLKHTVIENKCVIIGNEYDLDQKHYLKLGSVTRDDILRVIRRRFFHTAIFLRGAEIEKYYYQNPGFLISKLFDLQETDNIEKLAFAHLKYNLVFYFKQVKTNPINATATRINGFYPIHGNVLILHEMEDNIYTNLSKTEIKNIDLLSYGDLADREMTDKEKYVIDEPKTADEKEPTKTIPFWSRFLVTQNRLKILKDAPKLCHYCEKEIVTPIVCKQCFRVQCCSKKCFDNIYLLHFADCLMN